MNGRPSAIPPPPQPGAEVYVMDPIAEQRIARLESQVDGLKKAVRELADALQDELTTYDARVAALDERTEELARIQANQARAIKKHDERFKKSVALIADALSGLGGNIDTLAI